MIVGIVVMLLFGSRFLHSQVVHCLNLIKYAIMFSVVIWAETIGVKSIGSDPILANGLPPLLWPTVALFAYMMYSEFFHMIGEDRLPLLTSPIALAILYWAVPSYTKLNEALASDPNNTQNKMNAQLAQEFHLQSIINVVPAWLQDKNTFVAILAAVIAIAIMLMIADYLWMKHKYKTRGRMMQARLTRLTKRRDNVLRRIDLSYNNRKIRANHRFAIRIEILESRIKVYQAVHPDEKVD